MSYRRRDSVGGRDDPRTDCQFGKYEVPPRNELQNFADVVHLGLT